MSRKDIAKYQAMHNDTSIDEEMRNLKARAEVNYEALYGVKVPMTYEKAKWLRKNNKMGGKI